MTENKNPSFWSSLPGVITALAGMITAIAVLVTTLANLPSSNSSRTPEPTQAATSGGPGASAGTESSSPGGSPKSTLAASATPRAIARDIVFFSIRIDPDTGARNPDVYTVDPKTGDERRKTTDPQPDSNPMWSPDGTRIAFDSFRTPNHRNIWVREQDGSYTQLTNDQSSNAYPAWSPDGKSIAFSVGPIGSREIWVMDARDGSKRKRLTTGFDDIWPSWGVNGRIAFTRRGGGSSAIWVVNPEDRSASARITVADGGVFDPAWSPDGKRIAFSRLIGDIPRIFIAAANGHSGVKQLTPTQTCDCIIPTWSPDGTEIAYEGPGHGDRPIMVIPVDGGKARRVTTNGLAPRWGS
jgi:Tol biopolymer transport system component